MTVYDRNISGENVHAPVIAGVEITTDAFGRFNLNALHRASGEGKHKTPSKWIETLQAKELIAELEDQTPNSGFGVLNVIRGGNAPGTFAAEELAVSYAGWINASFQLEVNRTFIAYRKGDLRPTMDAPSIPSPAATREARLLMKMLLALGKEAKLEPNQRLLSANQATLKLTGVDLLGAIGVKQIEAPQPAGSLNPSDIGARLGGRKARVINLALTAEGFQTEHRDARGKPTGKGISVGAIMADTAKRSSDGTPVRQLRWAGSIVEHLRPVFEGSLL